METTVTVKVKTIVSYVKDIEVDVPAKEYYEKEWTPEGIEMDREVVIDDNDVQLEVESLFPGADVQILHWQQL